jgi:hypothetical protein
MASSHDLFARRSAHSGRGEQPGAGLSQRGAGALFIASAAGAHLARWTGIRCGFRHDLGSGAPGPRPSRGDRGRGAGGATGSSFGARARMRLRWPSWCARPCPGGDGAHGVVGHRGHHERAAPGPGFTAGARCSSSAAATTGTRTRFWWTRLGLATQGVTRAVGVPDELVGHTLGAEYNDLAGRGDRGAVRRGAGRGDRGAVAGTWAWCCRRRAFWKACAPCATVRALLIFDEVITGFRGRTTGPGRFKVTRT